MPLYIPPKAGTVTGVTAADTSVVVGGTAAAPTIATATLDVIAADHAPAAAWSNNSKKITGLANGVAASDAAAFGQTLPLTSIPASGALAQTIPPYLITTSAIAAASGSLYLHAIELQAGQTVSNITFAIGTTAGATLTHGWFVLTDASFLQAAHTADQTSGGLTASTLVTKALTGAYVVPATGTYWIGYVVVATTQPTMAGSATPQGGSGFAVTPVAGISTTGLTAPGTDASTSYLAPTAAIDPVYGYVT